MHACGPCAKARCRRALARATSKRSGSANSAGSRLAAAIVDRYATADVELAGAPIGCGELVRVSIAGANRDPAVFPDPDRFDVGRSNARRHVAFARGPHVCIGMHLARLESHTAVKRLLERLPNLRLDPASPTAPRGLAFSQAARAACCMDSSNRLPDRSASVGRASAQCLWWRSRF